MYIRFFAEQGTGIMRAVFGFEDKKEALDWYYEMSDYAGQFVLDVESGKPCAKDFEIGDVNDFYVALDAFKDRLYKVKDPAAGEFGGDFSYETYLSDREIRAIIAAISHYRLPYGKEFAGFVRMRDFAVMMDGKCVDYIDETLPKKDGSLAVLVNSEEPFVPLLEYAFREAFGSYQGDPGIVWIEKRDGQTMIHINKKRIKDGKLSIEITN